MQLIVNSDIIVLLFAQYKYFYMIYSYYYPLLHLESKIVLLFWVVWFPWIIFSIYFEEFWKSSRNSIAWRLWFISAYFSNNRISNFLLLKDLIFVGMILVHGLIIINFLIISIVFDFYLNNFCLYLKFLQYVWQFLLFPKNLFHAIFLYLKDSIKFEL